MITTAILLTLVLYETIICVQPQPIYSEQTSRHGGGGGIEYKFACPYNGAFSDVKYRSGTKVDQLEFICTSYQGRTSFGPFGGSTGNAGVAACPQKHYISSVYGRSGTGLDQLGIRCRHESDMNSTGQLSGEFGGTGGGIFDDLAYSARARPVAISVRAGNEVDAIQFTYGNTPLTSLCTDCSLEEWAPKHGGGGGSLQSFICPYNGVITGIKYRSGDSFDSIQFTCTSALGETLFGPYGGSSGDGPYDDKCPPGSYISSIHGRSGLKIDKLGIRCVKYGQVGNSAKRDGHGGNGGSEFDDESYTTRWRRPSEIRVWSGWTVDAIQVKYGDMPVFLNCKVSKIEVISTLIANVGIEVIGVGSGSTCSTIEQKVILESDETVIERVDVETTQGGEFDWEPTISITFPAGDSVVLTPSVRRFWSYTHSKPTMTETEKAQHSQIVYFGPGACLIFSYLNVYKIEQNDVPVLYHFKCSEGDVRPQPGTIKLARKTYATAQFRDYHFDFNNYLSCTSAAEARSCVAALNANNVNSDPRDMQTAFNRCFE